MRAAFVEVVDVVVMRSVPRMNLFIDGGFSVNAGNN
jgi:hypothetical protein